MSLGFVLPRVLLTPPQGEEATLDHFIKSLSAASRILFLLIEAEVSVLRCSSRTISFNLAVYATIGCAKIF